MKRIYFIFLISLLVLLSNGCALNYLRRADTLTVQFKSIQPDITDVGDRSKELNRLILEQEEFDIKGVLSELTGIISKVQDLRLRVNDITMRFGEIKSTPKAPWVKKYVADLFKTYHQSHKNLLYKMGGQLGHYKIDPYMPIRIEIDKVLEYVSLKEVMTYRTFLMSSKDVTDYLKAVELILRAYQYKLSGESFFAYYIKPFQYDDIKQRVVSSYIVEKSEISNENVDLDYLAGMRYRLFDIEEDIRDALSTLIDARNDINGYFGDKIKK